VVAKANVLMESPKQLCLLGVSFRTAPVAVREALRFQPDAATALLREAVAAHPGREALIISTCNRTEFYLAAESAAAAMGDWLGLLRASRPGAPILREDCQRYQLTGVAAARHLFRVATGLDSAILGDSQILGQVKEAMNISARAGALGGTLHQAVTQAIRTGKRARSETALGRGAASLGSAIASMLAEHELPLRQAGHIPRVLILGAGEIARDIGRHASKGGGRQLTFINRTWERAQKLAEFCGGQAQDWAALPAALAQADVVVAATACPKPILRREQLDQALARQCGREFLIMDAGVPRNVETGSRARVIDIDAIRERQEANLSQRRSAVPAVEQIVEEAVTEWEAWLAARPVESLIKSLYQAVATASRHAAEHWGGLDEAARFDTEQCIHRSLKRLLSQHVRGWRRLSPVPRPPLAAA